MFLLQHFLNCSRYLDLSIWKTDFSLQSNTTLKPFLLGCYDEVLSTQLLVPGGAVNHLAMFPRIIAVPERVNHSFPLTAKCLVGCRLASLRSYMDNTSLCTAKVPRASQETRDACTPVPAPRDAKAPAGSKAGSGLQEGAEPLSAKLLGAPAWHCLALNLSDSTFPQNLF